MLLWAVNERIQFMPEILREFMANYHKLSLDAQASIRLKAYVLGFQFIALACLSIVLCIDASQALSNKGLNPLIAPTVLALVALLTYKLLVFLIRSGSKD